MKRLFACLLVLTLLLTGCTGKPSSGEALMESVKPSQNSQELLADSQSNGETSAEPDWDYEQVTDFGMRLFRASFDEKKNTLISPYSVLAALAMTANGAEGQTLSQMDAVLGQSRDCLNSWYKCGTDPDDDVLHLANGIWFKDDPGLAVKEEFLQKNAKYFDAGIYKAPFDDTTRQDINSFVEEHTHGMIQDILDKIPEEAVMYLVNALAFEAQWQEVYKENQVHDATFITENSIRQDMELMWSEENLYLENDLATGFIKPYQSKNDRYAFAVLLPKEGVTVKEMVEALDGKQLQSLLANPQTVTVDTAIPKFEVEFDTEMSEILMAMGMTDAFDSNLADFSGLGASENGNIYLSRVIHKTFISVAEKGTKAGAATVVEVAAEAAMEEEVKSVILDRPFLYMIVDRTSNTPIFMGALMNMGEEKDLCIEHSHTPAEDPQVLPNPATGYCGNIQTTVYLDGEEYTFMYDDSVTLTDLLINQDYDPNAVCRCAAEFTVDTEFMEGFQVNLTESFVRCERGQTTLTAEQVQTIRDIINNL